VAKVIAYMTAVWVSFWGVVTVMFPGEWHSLAGYLFFAFMMLTGIPGTPAALLLFHSWLEKRAIDQSPQALPPSAGGGASQPAAPAHPSRKPPPAGPRHTAYLSALAT
jgi:hypothetical protein